MKSKNLPIIIGIALPLVFITIISLVLFVPSFFIKPKHNFIYSIPSNSYYSYSDYKNTYVVEKNSLVLKKNPLPKDDSYGRYLTEDAPILYFYDVRNNSSHQITFEEAQRYILDPGPSSPDGYSIDFDYGSSGIFEIFGGNNGYRGYYIMRNGAKKKLDAIALDKYSYSGTFKLIGWIK
jgi:hypothetical protein